MRLNPFWMPALSIGLLFGTVFGAQAAGVWSTSGRDTSALDALTPADVKGWMTLQQVSDGIPIPLTELYPLMDIPAELDPSTALKDLEGVVADFEVSVLRERLSAWQTGAVPSGVSEAEDTAVPTAQPSPTSIPRPTDPPAPPTPAPATAAPPTTELRTPVNLACEVRGRMTLLEVSNVCQVELERLVAAAGLPTDIQSGTALKDLINQGLLADLESFKATVATLQSDR